MAEYTNVVILITTGSDDEARKVADVLLAQKKAACVNIVPRVNSLFWWQGKINSDEEILLIIKTRASILAEVVNLVKKVHSYEVPEIIALPIIGGNEEYLKWIGEEVNE